MKYRKLGKWGLKISELSLGSWMTQLKDTAQIDRAADIVRAAYENGINFFDCADGYNGGDSERFLGEILKDYPRRSLVLSSKVFFPTGTSVNDCGLSRKHIMESIDSSLRNMDTDYLDLYFCHRFDPETPLEETLQTLSDLVAQGKILYYGVSEWMPAQLERALGIIKEMNLRPISVLQPQYNMFDRFVEDELLQICCKNGIGITTFSPLSQGLLSGKYKLGGEIPKDSRAQYQEDRQINKMLTEENLKKVARLNQVAEKLGITMSQLALAWILRKEEISTVIMGASKKEQLLNNIKATDIELDQTVLDEIEAVLDYHSFVRKIG